MKKNWLTIILAVLIGSLSLSGCGPGGTTEPSTQPPVLTQAPVTGLPAEVDRTIRLDPATVDDEDSLIISSLVYDGLTRFDENGNPQPALAIDWTISDDGLNYILTLRQDVAFHSGTAFNADVVLANFNRWFDPQDPLHGSGTYAGWETYFFGSKGEFDQNSVPLSPFDGIEKVDDFTVIIHLNRPVDDLLANLAQPYFGIADPTVLAAQGQNYGTSAEATSGTGAYYVSAWTGTGITLSPNETYWGQVPAGEVEIGWK